MKSVKELLGIDIPREQLPLKAGISYFELLQLWLFEKTNYFNEAKEEFLKTGKKINFKEATTFKAN